jgi:pimeloyl-ACP methyl ester carboxylesterase
MPPYASADTGASAAPPIVVLHGFACPHFVMRPLADHLHRALARPVVRLQLGAGLLDIRDDAAWLQDEIEGLLLACGAVRADVVGHSMGGLVATWLLKYLDGGARVRRVVTLGTPHRGTLAAVPGAALLGLLSPAVWQMLPGSELVQELAEVPVPVGCELVSIAGEADALVPPGSTQLARHPGQWNARVSQVDHVGLLHERVCLDLVARLLV